MVDYSGIWGVVAIVFPVFIIVAVVAIFGSGKKE